MTVRCDDYERDDVNLQDTDRVRLGVWPPTHETCGTTNLDEIKKKFALCYENIGSGKEIGGSDKSSS